MSLDMAKNITNHIIMRKKNRDISMYTAYKRHYEPCEVCHPREMTYFEKEKRIFPGM